MNMVGGTVKEGRNVNVKREIILKDVVTGCINRREILSHENIRYLHMSNEPGMMGLKMRQDMAAR